MSGFLSYHNHNKQKRNERKQNQNRNVSCYIFTTPSQPEICKSGIHGMDNRIALLMKQQIAEILYRSEQALKCSSISSVI